MGDRNESANPVDRNLTAETGLSSSTELFDIRFSLFFFGSIASAQILLLLLSRDIIGLSSVTRLANGEAVSGESP